MCMYEIYICRIHLKQRFYGVMVSTSDSESGDPSSNLGRTFVFFFGHLFYFCLPIFCCSIFSYFLFQDLSNCVQVYNQKN